MSTKFQSNIYTLRFDIINKVCLYLKLRFGSLHNRRRLTLVRERTNSQRYAQPCRGEIIEDRCSCSIFETQLSSTRVLDLQSKCEDYKYICMYISSWVYEIWVDFFGGSENCKYSETKYWHVCIYVLYSYAWPWCRSMRMACLFPTSKRRSIRNLMHATCAIGDQCMRAPTSETGMGKGYHLNLSEWLQTSVYNLSQVCLFFL